ncbi:MAG: glycosyltransferase family 4 protein [Cryobacterium sp.]|nr:glycosyltransferase family 4 protein [Oligoflexia bacterium]
MAFVKSLDEYADRLRSRMQPLLICLSRSWGGLEQTVAFDAVEFARYQLPVKVVVLKDSPLQQALADKAGIQVFALDYRPRDTLDFAFKRDLSQWIDQEGVNLVHTHQTTLLGSISPWMWNRVKIPLFASRHIMSGHNKKNFVHGAIYQRVDSLIVMSQALRENVLATHPVNAEKVDVVNLGLDFERFDPSRVDARRQRAGWGADPETIVIGLVGRIDPAKGQGTFIKAAAGLMKRMGKEKKLKFVIVGEETLGSEDGHFDELRAMVGQFHLEESVLFTGYLENIPEVMQAFDLFVMPSKQEAFGLVAIEAMAMECPIIISSGGSAREIVGREEFGLLTRPDDAFDLQQKLRELIEDEGARVRMGQDARAHVKSKYDRRLRLQKTLQLYAEAYEKRGTFL